ncbi:SDR family NAD(P)-dependent oxidoreductase [Stenotrophomonas acidaminiphila]|jgi:3-oxoacyl-[acyl-carrier protein] reductase|uniref:SDR family NAD(P)-dependent oxidoreductase n=1 Tax=Stenotrophomonas acidaminiphila TaxID=128780 RepID=UPI000BDAD969|nr:SDR family NAD(P)-dependent oxidoreductase [Stenotrophomonas acidaminiphila]OZB53205.1 MAG: 3-oxoacyl-ACP reductase [Stenotrophomonas sp. 14-69-23]WHL18511.1 SDR family NAD(P)-dependent oxidoreductase [Stenotrophomonas acidaminiphila]
MTVHQLGDARVLIAGGSRGIGLAIATAFARHGARLGLCARGIDGLQRARDTLQAGGAQVHVQACDLADPVQIQAWVEAAATALGGIDIVVNNASGFGHGNDDASWQAGFDIDLMAAVRTNRLVLPYLRRSALPAILNVSSINARVPTPRATAYSTAKAALDYYTVTLATELARERIRVNAIAPGSIVFPGGLWDQRRTSEPALYASVRDRIPFGGFGDPADVAAAAVFLCSPAARWITGQVLAVDGGQSLPA